MRDMSETVQTVLIIGLCITMIFQYRINANYRRKIDSLRDTLTDLYRQTNRAGAVLLIQDEQIAMLKRRTGVQEADSQPAGNTVDSEDEHKS